MTTPEQRAVWAALAAVATPGEWTATSSTVHRDAIPADSFVGHVAICGFGEQADADAAFIAAARTAVPALLADVDALTQERDALAAELERVRGGRRVSRAGAARLEEDGGIRTCQLILT
jgi:hypothetical protein